MNYITNKGKTCYAEGCKDSAVTKGLCTRHYGALRKYGDPNHVIRPSKEHNPYWGKECIVEDCTAISKSAGRCKHHYQQHQRQLASSNKPLKTVTCRNCGLEFIVTSKGPKVYCSRNCRKDFKNKTLRKSLPPLRNCDRCEKEFQPRLSTPPQRFCSMDCRVKASRTKRKKTPSSRICEVCNESFFTIRDAKYCSKKCSSKARHQRNYKPKPRIKQVKPWTPSQKPPDGLAAIYQFVDKDTGLIKYIGSTVQAPNKRRTDHPKVRVESCNFEIIGLVPLELQNEEEFKAIQAALDEGHPLENKILGSYKEYEPKTERIKKVEEVNCSLCSSIFLGTKVGNPVKFCPPCRKRRRTKIRTTRELNDWTPDNKEDFILEFMKLVNINYEGCWIWIGSTTDKGYGRANLKGVSIASHILSFRLFKGVITNQINHKCNVEACCNPEHLYDGTQKENLRDQFLAGNRPHDMSSLKD